MGEEPRRGQGRQLHPDHRRFPPRTVDQQEHAQSPQEALSLGQCEKWKLSIFYIQFLFLSACCCQKQGNKIGKQISSDHFIHIVCATRTNSTRHVAFLLCICYWYLHQMYAKAEPVS